MPARGASAQTIGGEVIEAMTSKPLNGYPVRLLYRTGVTALSTDTTIVGRFGVPVLKLGGAEAYAPSEVQQVARARAVLPFRYPKDLMSYGIPGDVLVRFVVDSSGHARPGSVQVLRSTHPSFTRAVLETLRTVMFDPARVGGIAVPQVVEQPFTFSLEARR